MLKKWYSSLPLSVLCHLEVALVLVNLVFNLAAVNCHAAAGSCLIMIIQITTNLLGKVRKKNLSTAISLIYHVHLFDQKCIYYLSICTYFLEYALQSWEFYWSQLEVLIQAKTSFGSTHKIIQSDSIRPVTSSLSLQKKSNSMVDPSLTHPTLNLQEKIANLKINPNPSPPQRQN